MKSISDNLAVGSAPIGVETELTRLGPIFKTMATREQNRYTIKRPQVKCVRELIMGANKR